MLDDFSLTVDQRRSLRQAFLTAPKEICIAAQILVLLDQGLTAEQIQDDTGSSQDDVAAIVRQFEAGGVDAIIHQQEQEAH